MGVVSRWILGRETSSTSEKLKGPEPNFGGLGGQDIQMVIEGTRIPNEIAGAREARTFSENSTAKPSPEPSATKPAQEELWVVQPPQDSPTEPVAVGSCTGTSLAASC